MYAKKSPPLEEHERHIAPQQMANLLLHPPLPTPPLPEPKRNDKHILYVGLSLQIPSLTAASAPISDVGQFITSLISIKWQIHKSPDRLALNQKKNKLHLQNKMKENKHKDFMFNSSFVGLVMDFPRMDSLWMKLVTFYKLIDTRRSLSFFQLAISLVTPLASSNGS